MAPDTLDWGRGLREGTKGHEQARDSKVRLVTRVDLDALHYLSHYNVRRTNATCDLNLD
jgi:hypothetical protein